MIASNRNISFLKSSRPFFVSSRLNFILFAYMIGLGVILNLQLLNEGSFALANALITIDFRSLFSVTRLHDPLPCFATSFTSFTSQSLPTPIE